MLNSNKKSPQDFVLEAFKDLKYFVILARPAGFEPAVYGFQVPQPHRPGLKRSDSVTANTKSSGARPHRG